MRIVKLNTTTWSPRNLSRKPHHLFEVPNIADVAVTYRERPVLLAYQEVIINSSTATNNNFALDSIPAATAEERNKP
jgi:hypothetical protein